ncbi:MAG: DUF2169 domain-containing protein, partial [Polyangiaceae bacterium]|nr:DUF2169 domain-containing protein [Polyangiaceae bacterium]
MLELKNRTPFRAAIVPFRDQHGVDAAAVVVKGTFAWNRGARGARGETELAIADEQLPIARADSFHGEPGLSSVRQEADTCPGKAGTDVVLVGHAYGGRGVTEVEVELAVGSIRKSVRVTGERVYYRAGGALRISDPTAFEKLPLVFERAYGGEDRSSPDSAHHEWEQRNPVGVGFVARQSKKDLEGERLPNLEYPGLFIRGPEDRPPPAGFGFVARHWLPRRQYAGTYDERWERERRPALPEDFDPRFFHGAPVDQTTPRPLRGGERLHATGVRPGGVPVD